MLYEPRYTVGNVVQLVRGGQAYTVVWRGQIQHRYAGGMVRLWVYRLDDQHWDCYYEDELHNAWRWE
jgi:hypothetical protein